MARPMNERLAYVVRFCLSRVGSGNRESTRALCDCIEEPDGEQLLAELVRKAHRNARLAEGVRLMFDVSSVNQVAQKFGVAPL